MHKKSLHIKTETVIRTRRAADLPFAFDGSAGFVLSNDVSPTSESFSKVYYHRDNTQKFSVTTFSGCFFIDYRTTMILHRCFQNKKHGSLKKLTVTKPFYCPACLKKYLNFEFCRPASGACPTYRDTCGRLGKPNFVNKKSWETSGRAGRMSQRG